VITTEVAYARSSRPDQLQGLLERAGHVDFTPAPVLPTDGLRLAAER
jgi:hypothetical protein